MTLPELFKNVRFRLEGRVVHLTPSQKPKGSVLLSYFTYPFLTDKQLTGHTNYWEAVRLTELFIQRGYAVDVIDTTHTSFIPRKQYDICIDTHSNLDRLASLLGKNCIKVLYTLSSHWLFQNAASWQRSYNLLRRRGVALPPERLLQPSTSLECADIVLLLGNDQTASTYAYASKPEFRLSISAVREYEAPYKDFESNKKNFVWLGGAGAVHKGADLTLEVFAQEKDFGLWMVGKYLYPEFEKAYWTELHETKNIRSIGHLDLSSPQFEELRSRCVFMIYPSCAEGQSGGVIAAMHAGIIPILSKEAGVDVGDFGFILKENTIEEIRKTVRYVASLPAEELASRARKAWETARAHYTRAQFDIQISSFIDLLEAKLKKG